MRKILIALILTLPLTSFAQSTWQAEGLPDLTSQEIEPSQLDIHRSELKELRDLSFKLSQEKERLGLTAAEVKSRQDTLQRLLQVKAQELAGLNASDHHELLAELYAEYITVPDSRPWVETLVSAFDSELEGAITLDRIRGRPEQMAIQSFVNTLTFAGLGAGAHYLANWKTLPPLTTGAKLITLERSTRMARLRQALKNPRALAIWGAAALAGVTAEFLSSHSRAASAKISPLEGLRLVQINLACDLAWVFARLNETCSSPGACETTSETFQKLKQAMNEGALLSHQYKLLANMHEADHLAQKIEQQIPSRGKERLLEELIKRQVPVSQLGLFQNLEKASPSQVNSHPSCQQIALEHDLQRAESILSQDHP